MHLGRQKVKHFRLFPKISFRPFEKLADVPDQLQVETENQVEIEYKGPDHPALNVYDNYNFEHEYDNELPITEHREWVIGTIESNQVTIIQGKSYIFFQSFKC